jgi:fructose-1,6-bisphosphatase/sedoheptulose 1,7-bisphosphatase-like protein
MDDKLLPWIRSKIQRGESALCNECKKSVDCTNGYKLTPTSSVLAVLSAEDQKYIYICADCYKEKISNLAAILEGFLDIKQH